jgi:hypothetical protein
VDNGFCVSHPRRPRQRLSHFGTFGGGLIENVTGKGFLGQKVVLFWDSWMA